MWREWVQYYCRMKQVINNVRLVDRYSKNEYNRIQESENRWSAVCKRSPWALLEAAKNINFWDAWPSKQFGFTWSRASQLVNCDQNRCCWSVARVLKRESIHMWVEDWKRIFGILDDDGHHIERMQVFNASFNGSVPSYNELALMVTSSRKFVTGKESLPNSEQVHMATGRSDHYHKITGRCVQYGCQTESSSE